IGMGRAKVEQRNAVENGEVWARRCCAPTKRKAGRAEAGPYKRKEKSGANRYCWDEGAAEAMAVLPMAAPLTTSSTRRLRWRPSAVSLVATGCVLPKPRAVMEEAGTPCSARKSRTESARRSESC